MEIVNITVLNMDEVRRRTVMEEEEEEEVNCPANCPAKGVTGC